MRVAVGQAMRGRNEKPRRYFDTSPTLVNRMGVDASHVPPRLCRSNDTSPECIAPRAPRLSSPKEDRSGDNPPARVGRISYLKGDVSFLRADLDQWSQATINFPVRQMTGSTQTMEPERNSKSDTTQFAWQIVRT
jgi:hypothetical protein